MQAHRWIHSLAAAALASCPLFMLAVPPPGRAPLPPPGRPAPSGSTMAAPCWSPTRAWLRATWLPGQVLPIRLSRLTPPAGGERPPLQGAEVPGSVRYGQLVFQQVSPGRVTFGRPSSSRRHLAAPHRHPAPGRQRRPCRRRPPGPGPASPGQGADRQARRRSSTRSWRSAATPPTPPCSPWTPGPSPMPATPTASPASPRPATSSSSPTIQPGPARRARAPASLPSADSPGRRWSPARATCWWTSHRPHRPDRAGPARRARLDLQFGQARSPVPVPGGVRRRLRPRRRDPGRAGPALRRPRPAGPADGTLGPGGPGRAPGP